MAQHQRKPAPSGGGNAFNWILLAVAVIGVAAIAWAAFGRDKGGVAATGPLEIGSLEETQQLQQKAQPVRRGDEGAPVQIVEFADFQCPSCKLYETQVAPVLEPYIERGQVQVAFYDFPLSQVHQNAFIASRAARCAQAQDRFWDYHDLLYAQQEQWSYDRSPIDRFTGYAENLGLDAKAFESCLRSDQYQDVVTANALVGQKLGVGGTPTLYINGRNAMGAWQNARELEAQVRQALGPAATATPDSATR